MKKIIVCVLLCASSSLFATVGCCAAQQNRCSRSVNSYAVHPVQCACPCDDIVDETGLCRKCGHIGNDQRGAAHRQIAQAKQPDYSGAFVSVVRGYDNAKSKLN